MGGVDGALLIVDDDLQAAWSLARLLPRLRPETVTTAVEALSRCGRFEAFLLDVCLGLKDQHGGLALARELRARLPRAVIILVSGLVDWRDVDLHGLDVDAVLVKGDVSAAQLRKVIGEAHERRSGVAPQGDRADALRPLHPFIEDALDAKAQEQAAGADRVCTIARLVREAQKMPGPERRTLDAIGRALGVSRPTLLRYAQVGRAWSVEEIRELMRAPRSSKGGAISLSHLDAAARLAKSPREGVVKAAIEKSLTVEETRRLGRKGR